MKKPSFRRVFWRCSLLALLVPAACGTNEAGSDRRAVTQPVGDAAIAPDPPPDSGKSPAHGPGLVIMGGGADVDSAFVWMHDTITGAASVTGGDVVVLRASGDNKYDAYIARLARFSSVRTLLIPPGATPEALRAAASTIASADAVFFAGGDQADYVRWNGTVLMEAVKQLYARGGVVGGSSAGAAILGPFVFDSIAANAARRSVATADAVANPWERTISFTRGMVSFPTMGGVIVDPHFEERDRMGRLVAFIARQYADGAAGAAGVIGVGVGEDTALLVDAAGKATFVQQSTGGAAFILRPSGPADTCTAGQPLLYKGIEVMRLGPGQSFDFAKRCGTGTSYTLAVDGSTATPYAPASPYGAAGSASSCP